MQQPTPLLPTSLRRLRCYNLAAGALHFANCVAIGAISNSFSLPVVARTLTGQPGADTPPELVQLFRVSFRAALASFCFLSAAAHFLLAGPLWYAYTYAVEGGRNPYRWAEYAVTSSLMISLIALLTGIDEVAALLGLFGLNAAMIGCGWLQEVYESPGSGRWGPFALGCFAGLLPWVAIGLHLHAAPTFVVGIYVSLFLLFNVFALNQYLQFAQLGPWAATGFGEAVYILLSVVAKTALAWQIYASALILN